MIKDDVISGKSVQQLGVVSDECSDEEGGQGFFNLQLYVCVRGWHSFNFQLITVRRHPCTSRAAQEQKRAKMETSSQYLNLKKNYFVFFKIFILIVLMLFH